MLPFILIKFIIYLSHFTSGKSSTGFRLFCLLLLLANVLFYLYVFSLSLCSSNYWISWSSSICLSLLSFYRLRMYIKVMSKRGTEIVAASHHGTLPSITDGRSRFSRWLKHIFSGSRFFGREREIMVAMNWSILQKYLCCSYVQFEANSIDLSFVLITT